MKGYSFKHHVLQGIAQGRLCSVLIIIAALSACGEKKTAQEYLQQAQDYEAAGEFNAAVISYRESLVENSDDPQVRLLLGQLYLKLQNFASADKELARAQVMAPDNGAVLAARSQSLLGLKAYDQLIELAEPATDSVDALAAVQASKGLAYLAKGQQGVANEYINRSLELAPQNQYGGYARAKYLMVIGDLVTARQQLEQLLSIDESNAEYWALSSRLAQLEGDQALAQAAATQAIQHAYTPDKYRLLRAMLRLNIGEIDQANDDLSKLSGATKNLPGYHYIQGLVHTVKGDYATAQAEFDQVADVSEDYTPALYYAGLAHFKSDSYEQARGYFERYLAKTDSADITARRLLAETYLKLGRPIQSQRLLVDILRDDLGDIASLSVLADSLLATGNADKAAQVLEKIVLSVPDEAAFRLRLAQVYLNLNEPAKAVKLLQPKTPQVVPGEATVALYIEALLKAGMNEQAVKVAEDYLAQHNTAKAMNQLAEAYLISGDLASAEAWYGKILEQDKADSNANLAMSSIAAERGDLGAAQGYLQNLLKASPEDLPARTAMAGLALSQGDQEGFVNHLERAIKAHPAALEPRLQLGWFYSRTGKPGQVRELLSEQHPAHPYNVPLLQLLSSSAYSLGRYGEAQALLSQLLALRPANADVHYSMALNARQLGDRVAYRRELENTLRLQPEHFQARIALITMQLDSGDLSSAGDDLEKYQQVLQGAMAAGVVSDRQKQSLDTAYMRLSGRLLELQGQQTEAIKLYSQLFERTGNTLDLIRLSQTLVQAGRWQESQDSLHNWLTQHPDNVPVRLQYAKNFEDAGEDSRAAAEYEQVLEQRPDSAMALNNLALLLKSADNIKALDYANRAVALLPESLDVQDTLAMVLLSEGSQTSLRKAQRIMEQLLQARDANPVLLYHSALIDVELGDKASARSRLRQALQAGQTFPEEEKARTLLATIGS